jgi:hypothetical protein
MSQDYRKIWENINGPIPIDDKGRTYEIHHLDGDRTNNDIENLVCISIEEHYKIHFNQGDFGAAVMIAKRMELPPDYISSIQKGIKRPGVGGVKKGTIPWNKGRSGYKLNLSVNGLRNRTESPKRRSKIKEKDVLKIVKDFNDEITIDDSRIGKVMKNGKKMSYRRSFCENVSMIYGVTPQAIERILKIYVQEKR